MSSAGALNHICRPRGIVEARASLGTLHTAITGEKVAAHAKGKAVRLIRTQKLATLHTHDWKRVFMALSIIQSALDCVQVHDSRVGSTMSHLVDFLQPLHFTVTIESVVAQKELWQLS